MNITVQNDAEQPNPAENVYMSVSKFLWGRTPKLHIIIREYRHSDSDLEVDSISEVISIIEKNYAKEYGKENIQVTRMLLNGYSVIPL
ncbi:hypothetical protein [Brevibacillus reuszeri]|uniref:hypothetical protein n=1 Tax=Brevibacillus reuszeri TaxID=54915 RepID=UPI000CCBF289|nr:hypothetical protein [Brevibacillus reuszeri]